MATNKAAENDVCLPFAALQLLAPPVRLVSAALFKVMKQRDVMQYGTVEEFVTSACETVPGLLTLRHQGKLTLGLRGRLILELCYRQPDAKVIEPHLERMRPPAVPSTSSAHTVKDIKILKTVESFHALVQTLLTDPAEREQFFKEEFPLDYGPKFDQELEKLLWEFLLRLDQLLVVPNLAQTVSWLSTAPLVLEECARAATQPQLLKILLQHQTCLGHLESAASLPPNMGDSILTSLSLPPSGRVPSDQATGPSMSSEGQSTKSTPVPETSQGQTRASTAFITPVIGLISNEDVPAMISANKRLLRGDKAASSNDGTKRDSEPKENFKITVDTRNQKVAGAGQQDGDKELEEEQRDAPKRHSAIKRRLPEQRQSESEEEEEASHVKRPGRKRASRVRRSKQRANEECDRAALETSMTQVGVKSLTDDPSLCSLFASCLQNQPRVIIDRLKLTGTDETAAGGKSPCVQHQSPRRETAAIAPTDKVARNQPGKPEFEFPDLDNKENHPVLPDKSSSAQRRNTDPPGENEDYVADSEDEATKNFKVRLFRKRYHKTKHGTYLPTLREFWKPALTRRDFVSSGSKCRR
ncbi:TERF1-interacting nuclear factor 2 [Genypterus blacodes]|uniref:TERF1-interacting nuclear factor 2 n=1 Tax=Genypterus blacodes TaxID=154954 RepID=UPI003F75E46E